MEDARLDHLTGRLDSLHKRLLNRADQLDNEAVSAAATGLVTAPGRTPDALRVIASEFREIAGSLE
jgi:hypothetical protein